MSRKDQTTCSSFKNQIKILLVFILVLASVGQINAQNSNQAITLNITNANFHEFVKQVESKTNFTFIYRDVLIDTKKDINIQVENKPLADVIKTVLDKKGLAASFNNKT